MAVFSKQLLSGSTNGRSILVTQTATTGDTIHTAHATSTDEIWLWAFNSSAAGVKLTIEFGGTTAPNDTVEQTIGAESGFELVIPGLPLTNSLVVRAFAASANVVTINGYVNRVT